MSDLPPTDVIPAVARRFSPKAFAETPIPRETLTVLFQALRWAPSCYNDQPWRLIVGARGEGDTWDRLLGCLVPGNRQWAQTAPVLMLSVAMTRFRRNDQPNRHALHDVGLAMGNLLAQATALGLSVHQMAGFDVDAARREFAIPDACDPVAAAALGFQGGPERLPEGVTETVPAERERLPLTDIVYTGTFGASWFDES